jgi:hypothetical protein
MWWLVVLSDPNFAEYNTFQIIDSRFRDSMKEYVLPISDRFPILKSRAGCRPLDLHINLPE